MVLYKQISSFAMFSKRKTIICPGFQALSNLKRGEIIAFRGMSSHHFSLVRQTGLTHLLRSRLTGRPAVKWIPLLLSR